MTIVQIASLLIVASALFGVLNHFVLRLPQAIGTLLFALLASAALFCAEAVFPGLAFTGQIRDLVGGLHFSDALLEGMLGLLLFAGALHVDLSDLRRQALPIAVMATLGVAISTATVGLAFSWITGMPLLTGLVFGAIISPTDPVAVMGVLKSARIKSSLQIKIAGESLFNDGVGYVVFLILAGLAFGTGDGHDGAHVAGTQSAILSALCLFLREAAGGALLGGVLGWSVFQMMKRIDDYPLEVLLTLALAFGGYELAAALHVSAPIMAVVAGLFIGHVGPRWGMSRQTRSYVDAFWKLIDEILNAVLFLMIGAEILVVTFSADIVAAGSVAIALALGARLVSVALPVLLLSPVHRFSRGVIPVMTWGGLKGGISIALALSLPETQWKPVILGATYMVVVFSILVQGLSVAPLARRVTAPLPEAAPKAPNEETFPIG